MFQVRLNKVKQKIKNEKLDGVLISSVPNIAYLTGYSNFFKEERDGYVLITENANYILTHSIYSQALKGKIPNFKVIEISRREPPEKVMQKILKNPSVQIGIEEHDLKVYEYKKLLGVFKNLKNFDFKVKRSVKDKDEIELIAKACKIGDEVFEKVLKRIKLGISEKQLAYEIDNEIKKLGFDNSFRTIVAFGKNAAYPHHLSGNDILGPESSSGREGLIILLDFGVKFENYCSDMTRTIFFGNPNDKQRKIYQTVLDAQKQAVDFINSCLKKGKKIMAKDVDSVARKYIISKGFPSIPHSLGHGIGLEVHEHPHISQNSKEILQEGMVFSIEPGIYLPAGRQGIEGGVRIEDLFVLENGKLRQLTHSNSNLLRV